MATVFTEERKKELTEELKLKNRCLVEGIRFDPKIFTQLGVGTDVTEQVNILFAGDRHSHVGIDFPAAFYTPKGKFYVQVKWDLGSPVELKFEDGQFNIYDWGKLIFEKIEFFPRPLYYDKKTSDGTFMRTVAADYAYGSMFVAYSNECSLKDKGLDCLFCNINATKALYGEAQGITWKTPRQIGETIAEGYKLGYSHLTISGGFVPERREVEYYLDVAESIQEHTGLTDFNGTACVGAPNDLSVFDKYKEAGYRTVATNMEVWNPDMFEVICPGKARECGGRENWLNALKYEVDVFGKYKVRSTFVSGLEPKESLLEGVDLLTSQGVLPCVSQWNVNVGSPLEGHRTPTDEWHWDMFEKTVAIYRKYGVKWSDLRDANASVTPVPFDLFRIYEGIDNPQFDN